MKSVRAHAVERLPGRDGDNNPENIYIMIRFLIKFLLVVLIVKNIIAMI